MYIVTEYDDNLNELIDIWRDVIEYPVIFMHKALTETLASVLKCLTNIAVVRSLYSKIMQMNGNNKQSKTR